MTKPLSATNSEVEMAPAKTAQLSPAALNILRGLKIDPKKLMDGKGHEYNTQDKPNVLRNSTGFLITATSEFTL